MCEYSLKSVCGGIRILGVAVVECLDIDCSYNTVYMYEVLVIPYGEWIIITQ